MNSYFQIIKNFLSNKIIAGFLFSIVFSLPIYFAALCFQILKTPPNKFIISLLSLISFYIFFIQRSTKFYFALFVPLLWFYWIGFSFRFSNYPFLGIFADLFIFAIFFAIIYLSLIVVNEAYRLCALAILPFIHPFYFDWFNPQILLAFSYFDNSYISYIAIISSVCLFAISLHMRPRNRIFSIIISVLTLSSTINFSGTTKSNIDASIIDKIAITNSNINQNEKWQFENISDIIAGNIGQIEDAIRAQKEMVILPETAFPIPLNMDFGLDEILKSLSKKITIITGGIKFQNDKYFNSTYIYQKGELKIIDKVVLVPFGEYIPLPEFLLNFVPNDLKESINLNAGNKFENFSTTINGKNLNFRNAICYEGSSSKTYEDSDFDALVLISNNAWFTPSIEPTMQRMLIQTRINNLKKKIVVLHSVNKSESYILKN